MGKNKKEKIEEVEVLVDEDIEEVEETTEEVEAPKEEKNKNCL